MVVAVVRAVVLVVVVADVDDIIVVAEVEVCFFGRLAA